MTYSYLKKIRRQQTSLARLSEQLQNLKIVSQHLGMKEARSLLRDTLIPVPLSPFQDLYEQTFEALANVPQQEHRTDRLNNQLLDLSQVAYQLGLIEAARWCLEKTNNTNRYTKEQLVFTLEEVA